MTQNSLHDTLVSLLSPWFKFKRFEDLSLVKIEDPNCQVPVKSKKLAGFSNSSAKNQSTLLGSEFEEYYIVLRTILTISEQDSSEWKAQVPRSRHLIRQRVPKMFIYIAIFTLLPHKNEGKISKAPSIMSFTGVPSLLGIFFEGIGSNIKTAKRRQYPKKILLRKKAIARFQETPSKTFI